MKKSRAKIENVTRNVVVVELSLMMERICQESFGDLKSRRIYNTNFEMTFRLVKQACVVKEDSES